jgi:hypothetical protein
VQGRAHPKRICVELIQAMLGSSVLKVLGSKRAPPITSSTHACQSMGTDAVTDEAAGGFSKLTYMCATKKALHSTGAMEQDQV